LSTKGPDAAKVGEWLGTLYSTVLTAVRKAYRSKE